jgi:hypothetical protein
MNHQCQICCENLSESKITTQKNKQIKCNYCEIITCCGCVQKYIISTDKEPSCMGCGMEWTRDFLDSNLQKGYMKGDFIIYRENMLMNKEKSMLAEAQFHANHVLEKEACDKKIQVLCMEFERVRNKLNTERNGKYQLIRLYENGEKKGNSKSAPILHRQCCVEECKGFIGKGWKCGICEVKICSSCHEIVKKKVDGSDEESHVCVEENVANAKALMTGTKPCPRCATLIFKIDGCSQMFCVSCHAAFDWKTGLIEKGKIHNPHYYEHLRMTIGAVPRDPDDILPNENNWACMEPTLPIIRARLKSNIGIAIGNVCKNERMKYKFEDYMSLFVRLMYHVSEYELPVLTNELGRHQVNLDLRVQYLLNRIDEKTWKQKLQQREKKLMKIDDIHKVTDMFHTVLRESIQKILTFDNVEECVAIFKSVFELQKYANEEYRKISKRYNNNTPFITKRLTYDSGGQNKNGSIRANTK